MSERTTSSWRRERESIGRIRSGDGIEQQRRIGDVSSERAVGVEVRPRRNHSRARHQPERRLHPDDSAELRRDSVGAAIVCAERGERDSAGDRDSRAGARATRCLRTSGIIGIAHLAGKRAGAVAVIGEIIRRCLAKHDRARGTHPRNLDRIAGNRVGKKLRPIGARARGGETVHVVDRLGEHWSAIERSTERSAPSSQVGRARLVHSCRGKHVDRVQSAVPGACVVESFPGYLLGAPITARASGLVFDDRAGERIAETLRPSNERNGEERAQLGQRFASGNAADHRDENLTVSFVRRGVRDLAHLAGHDTPVSIALTCPHSRVSIGSAYYVAGYLHFEPHT